MLKGRKLVCDTTVVPANIAYPTDISLLGITQEKFLKEAAGFLATASSIMTQQKDIYKGLKVKERIVSIHKPHIRPMVRGKYPVEVEFGPKVLLNLKNNFLFLEDLQFNNVSDAQLLDTAIKGYKERFNSLPTQLTTDRGFWSPENYTLAEDYGIAKIAIENKGKSSYLKGKPL